MWLVLSTFPAFPATMEIIFLSPSQEKRGKMEKNKNKSGPQKRFFRTYVFRFLSKGVRQAALGFCGEAGCLHCMLVVAITLRYVLTLWFCDLGLVR